MSELTRHPLSAAFPTFSDEDIATLAEDIRQFGQRESGLLLDGQILDGWNRYSACQIAGVEFNCIDFEDEYPDVDPVAFVLSKNLHRRHLTASQRAAAVVACAQWAPNGRPGNSAPGAPFRTNADLAREADVSPRTIKQAKVAHEAGLSDSVIAGEISLKQADAHVKATRTPKVVEHVDAEEIDDATPVKPFSLPQTDEQSSTDESDDPYVEIERLHDQVATLQREIDSLSASDSGAEVLKLNQLLINEENKVKSFEVKMKALNLFGQRFADLRKILDVKYDRDVVGAVRKLVEASK